MKIIIVTQDNPIYIAKSVRKLIEKLKQSNSVIGCIVSSPSPFGKKESFIQKAINTFKIFGPIFFIRYTFLYIKNKLSRKDNLSNILNDLNIKEIRFDKSINHKSSLDVIEKMQPDLLISIAGNEIFKKELINIPSNGSINLHTALLPKYRGLMPAFWVLKNNEEYTGVSVFFIDEGIDSGDIIYQEKIKINDMTHAELIEHTKEIGVNAICKAVDMLKTNNYNLIYNDDSKKSYFSFPTKEDVKDFKKIGKKFF